MRKKLPFFQRTSLTACGAIVALWFVVTDACAQEIYFYKGRVYGSETLYNPMTLILNGSFDVLQHDNNSRDIVGYNFASNTKFLFRTLGNPVGVLSRTGWDNFFQDEIFPYRLNAKRGNWWPNYQLHLIGGGMSYVAMSEWYEQHDVPEPQLCSIATMAFYHLLNEVVELNGYQGDIQDPIADIYIFDPVGIILFSFGSVKEFFSKTMNLADWSLQPSIGLPSRTLENSGQYFSIKWKFPFSERWHLFYYFGMAGLAGVSYKDETGASISFGAGLRAKAIRRLVVDESRLAHEADLSFSAGLFYDIDNSLIASIVVKGWMKELLNINVYPGVLRIGSFSPGLWLNVLQDGGVMVGAITRWAPGVGLGKSNN